MRQYKLGGQIMESIKIRTYVGDDGILQIQLPPEVVNQELDVVIVFQPVSKTPSQSPNNANSL
jgi:hypothetical protein